MHCAEMEVSQVDHDVDMTSGDDEGEDDIISSKSRELRYE
jgi:hypothetical protein